MFSSVTKDDVSSSKRAKRSATLVRPFLPRSRRRFEEIWTPSKAPSTLRHGELSISSTRTFRVYARVLLHVSIDGLRAVNQLHCSLQQIQLLCVPVFSKTALQFAFVSISAGFSGKQVAIRSHLHSKTDLREHRSAGAFNRNSSSVSSNRESEKKDEVLSVCVKTV